LNVHGAVGATQGEGSEATLGAESWARLAGPVDAGATELCLSDASAAASWPESTDLRVILTTTDYLAAHTELLTVRKKANGCLDIVEPVGGLEWDHHGDKLNISSQTGTHLNTAAMSSIEDLRAVVGLLSRSITVESLGATPTDELMTPFGAHTLVRQGFRSYQVSGVLFEKLGQGGSIGRYAIHWHKVRVTDGTSWARDCSVFDSNTRFVSIHGTHSVELSRLVGFRSFGSSIFIEDGSEINNKLLFNLVAHARVATNDPVTNPRNVTGIFAYKSNLFFYF
jgi:hypothetical protein